MIVGHVKYSGQEMAAFAPLLRKGLEYIRNTDFNGLGPGRHDIDGDRLYAIVSDYRTEPKSSRRPESHVEYVDIQYVQAGREIIGVSCLTDNNEITEDLRAERDLIFYREAIDEQDIVLTAGMYMILFPWDVHRPGCAVAEGEQVRKVVVKVKWGDIKGRG